MSLLAKMSRSSWRAFRRVLLLRSWQSVLLYPLRPK